VNDPLAAYRNAIASIESAGSGDYSAIGPTHPRLGRALGRYQVMEENVGPWSREAIGREVSPEEFLANPAIQDAIFNHEFGKYVNRYGPEGAAQAWFGGPGNVGNLNVQDALGTSVGEYGQKFSQALGNVSPNGPLQARQSTMNAQPGIMQFLSGQGQQGQPQPFYKNPDLWDTLAIGLGGMSTRPNEAIIGAAQQRMQERRIDRRETEQRNQTLQWLASQGRDDLVAAVTAGLPITDAMNIALTPAQMPEPERGVVVGQNVVDPVTGRIIYEGPLRDDTSSAEQEINLLTEIGLTRDDAIRVTQLYTISRDPLTGEAILLDKSTGQPVQYNPLSQQSQITTTVLDPAAQTQVAPLPAAPEATTSEFGQQYPDATSAFGLPGFARWGANVLTGTVGQPMFPSAQQSTAGFGVLRESLVNDIASGYDRQPPSWLLKNIQDLTPVAANPFVGVDQAISQLDALGNNFLTELSSLQTQAQGSLSPTDRAAINQRVQAVQTGLNRIRQARQALLQEQSPAQTDEDFEAILEKYSQ
jgi:hypothetical protein